MDRRPAAPSRAAGLLAGLAVVVIGAYFVALHWLVARGAWPTVAIALILAPWLVVIGPPLSRTLRAGSPVRRTVFAALAGGAAGGLGWLLTRFGATLGARADVVLYVENFAFFAWLCGLFAATLSGGREPLVTRLARRMRGGDMPPSVVRYTRGVTIAWAAFFACAILTSTLLFFTQSREAWSLFVNLLIWPLVGAAFVVEYVVRTTLLKDVTHLPFAAAIRAFRGREDGDR